VVMDAGMKSITPEFGLPQPQPGHPDMAVYKLSEEHSLAELRGDAIALAVGDVVELIPSHGCTTINLFDYMYGVRNGIIECILPIAGRGKSA